MSASSLLLVILSDERSEESKDPFGPQQSQAFCCATLERLRKIQPRRGEIILAQGVSPG
jgi:hypothetical protein